MPCSAMTGLVELVLSEQILVSSAEPWENLGNICHPFELGLSSGEGRTLHSAGRCCSHCNFRRNLLTLHVQPFFCSLPQ